MSGLPPPMYVPQQAGQQGGYMPPMYHGMPTQPQPQPQQPPAFPPQGQPMMYASQPVSGAAPGGVYAQPVMGVPAAGVYGQPAPTEHVVLVNHQPHEPLGIFTDGLFDCFNDGASCLLSTFCAPIRWGLTVSRAGFFTLTTALVLYGLLYWGQEVFAFIQWGGVGWNCSSSTTRTPYGSSTVETCDAGPLTYVFAALITICAVGRLAIGTAYRGKIRAQHAIPGSGMEDCCLHLWCSCCAIAQEARHVDRMTGHLQMPHVHVPYQQFHH